MSKQNKVNKLIVSCIICAAGLFIGMVSGILYCIFIDDYITPVWQPLTIYYSLLFSLILIITGWAGMLIFGLSAFKDKENITEMLGNVSVMQKNVLYSSLSLDIVTIIIFLTIGME